MGTTKTALFTPSQNELANLAKALAHPARIAILQYLASTKSCINGTLVQELGLAQATISQHLRELKELGLICGTIKGVTVNYCLDTKRWEQVQQHFISFFAQLSAAGESSGCCE
jgi:DNA-binding transcriptional ArsR family regulator